MSSTLLQGSVKLVQTHEQPKAPLRSRSSVLHFLDQPMRLHFGIDITEKQSGMRPQSLMDRILVYPCG